MSVQRSTIRGVSDSSVNDRLVSPAQTHYAEEILAYWRQQPDPDVMVALKVFPSLVHQKSLFLDLVLEEYKTHRDESPRVAPARFSDRYRELNSTLRRSIVRLLEVQDYLDSHPELLELVEAFEWPEIGDVIHRFQIVDELGRGAAARVYLCRESNIGQRAVVVKVARSGEYEADLLGRLSHPNIVPVYSIFNDVSRHATYICMPFRGRCTLQDVVDYVFEYGVPRGGQTFLRVASDQQSPIDVGLIEEDEIRARQIVGTGYVSAVIRVVLQIADALSHAHAKGVFHGDLKPSNVLLTPQGAPLLIDFNLGKAQWAELAPCGGTLPYMAPEQLTSFRHDFHLSALSYNVRSEIYSFGVVLFQLLTGRLPFHVDGCGDDPVTTAEHLLAQQHVQVPFVRPANRFANSSLEALVRQCLELEPSRRPENMDELLERLRAELRLMPHCRRAIRAQPLASFVAATLLSAAVIGAALFLGLRPPYHERQFNRGLELQQAGEYQSAAAYFDNALVNQPAMQEALYERARTKMLAGDLDGAINDFSRLHDDFGDVRGMAYSGYCFNLMKQPTIAIDKYERALAAGFESSGLHNNLGVSYQMARSRLDYGERLVAAERHLKRALDLDNGCAIARWNLIDLVVRRFAHDSSYSPAVALVHVEAVTNAFPRDARAWISVARLYGSLSMNDQAFAEMCANALQSAFRHGGGPTRRQLSDNPEFQYIKLRPEFAQLYAIAKDVEGLRKSSSSTEFIDPVESGLNDTASREQ